MWMRLILLKRLSFASFFLTEYHSEVEDTKCLGLEIDENVIWLAKSEKECINSIWKIKPVIDRKHLIQVYKFTTDPYFE